ncbi:inorganic phosphate transporter [Pimelobacter simplex]|uniref:Putative low-affinity inorganic phosphate transporter n=1 Tax=Nocardioides simplex TaxID=2045 RepID=A0A0A1DNE9_NOCSI|nr:inorganic phosphate transporter [Pimelobacter simplex]AIY18921.1 putative low-affinity inorganic phosphate transporter [Pimelobacter simplex]MCG8148847.1 inorganic phosphate transporter [Pimelobacter simplex]GEB14664.1 inorganic phosphate transporter [Pimelobacter simplex]SFM27065.1 inorganic phosphate transporter, PiT family [Pimelobacter simplex]
MTLTLAIVIAVVVIALAFDYTNGFHDAANAIATSVSTRALTPRIALTLAALMNFIGALLGQEVAKTVADVITIEDANGTLQVGVHHGLVIVMAGLLGAIIWNLITWYFGLPSSSSHALIGGLVGAAIAGGVSVKWDTIVQKVLIPMVVSPLFGFLAAFAVMTAILWIFRKSNPHKVNRGFRGMQTVSAAALALGHGLQDAQKTMGVILLTLVIAYPGSYDIETLPIWVVLAAAGAISAGTYAGGWRIMRTLGRKIIHLDPPRGFAAESVGAGVLYTTAFVFHAPISTTHTITSAVMGAGATKRLSAVRWGMARTILAAWVSTFPAAALAAWGCYELLHLVLL